MGLRYSFNLFSFKSPVKEFTKRSNDTLRKQVHTETSSAETLYRSNPTPTYYAGV